MTPTCLKGRIKYINHNGKNGKLLKILPAGQIIYVISFQYGQFRLQDIHHCFAQSLMIGKIF